MVQSVKEVLSITDCGVSSFLEELSLGFWQEANKVNAISIENRIDDFS